MKRILIKTLCGSLLLAGSSACGGGNTVAPEPDASVDALEVIFTRTSVRTYKETKPEQEKVGQLVRAAMAAPSGMDRRPWEIVVIDDRAVLDAMAEGLPAAQMLAEAPLAIVVCGNTERSSYWYLDCAAATQNILLAAHAQGLGAVWTAAYPYEDRMSVVSSALGLPANIRPLAVVPVGYPGGEHTPKEKYDPSKVHFNHW